MQAEIFPARVEGYIEAAASKSAMQRACAAALIKKGATLIDNAGTSNDDLAALQIIQQLGATVARQGTRLRIQSNGVHPVANRIFCGESGLSIRMFTPIAATSAAQIVMDGEGSLKKRPMQFFADVLPQLGVVFSSAGGKAPLEVSGPLQPLNITIDGSQSSQYLTGLLFAYAALDAANVTITVQNLASKPYVDLTLRILQLFGLKVPQNISYETFYFTAGAADAAAETVEYRVEGDWSGAAFLLVAGALAGQVKVSGLDAASTQADRAILHALSLAGAAVKTQGGGIIVSAAPLVPFVFDATDCPDLFPPLVSLAAACAGVSRIGGIHRLTHKESNRALTLQQEFLKFGIAIAFEGDEMLVHGGAKPKAAALQSHDDHRIAMACAVTALTADGRCTIDGAEAVNKSYPLFWRHLALLLKQNTTVAT